MSIRRLDSSAETFEQELSALIEVDFENDDGVTQVAADVIATVRSRGDAAVLEYTRRFDALEAGQLTDLALDADACEAAYLGLPGDERDALDHAAQRIRAYHERQLES